MTTVTSGMKEEWKEQWSFNKYVNNRLDEQDGRHDKHDEDISKLQSTAKKQEAQNAELRRKVNILEKSQVKLQKLVDKQQQVLGPVASRLFGKSLIIVYYSLVSRISPCLHLNSHCTHTSFTTLPSRRLK